MSQKVFEPELRQQRLLIVGRSGFGKSYAAKGSGVEPELAVGTRVGIWDPTNAWFGLRKKPDGVRDAFPLVIFGGPNGDLPINEDSGALLGKTLATAGESWIISLRDMKGAKGRRRFAADFFDALYDHNSARLLLIVDEADTVAPEKANDEFDSRSGDALEEIVKRGRLRGFTPWLITQRPADLAKSCSSQADAIVSMSLTLPHDKKAIEAYIKDHDEDGTAGALFKDMPRLPKGEGIVWWPGGNILERRHFSPSKTFDSGKPPEAGATRITLKPLKVEALAAAMEEAIKDRDAKDPEKLLARIQELERTNQGLNELKPEAAAADLDAAREEGFDAGLLKGYDIGSVDGQSLHRQHWTGEFQEAASELQMSLSELDKKVAALRDEEVRPIRPAGDLPAYLREKATKDGPAFSSPVAAAAVSGVGISGRSFAAATRAVEARAAMPSTLHEGLTKPQQRVLDAMAWWAAIGHKTVSREQVAVVADYSPTSGGYGNIIGQLKTMNMLEFPSAGFLSMTSVGIRKANKPGTPPSRAELHIRIMGVLSDPQKKVMTPVLRAFPRDLAREEIAKASGYEPTSGGFGNLIGQLRTLTLVDFPKKGHVKAADFLFAVR